MKSITTLVISTGVFTLVGIVTATTGHAGERVAAGQFDRADKCSEIPEPGPRDESWTEFDQFPMPVGSVQQFSIDNGKYLGVKFTAPAQGDAGYLSTQVDSHAPNDAHLMAVSSCPGDFDEALAKGVCKKYSYSHTFWWSTFGEYEDVACELRPGQVYYLNIMYSLPDTITQSKCHREPYCGAMMGASN